MFSNVLEQFHCNKRSSDVIQPVNSEPQYWLFSQEFVPIMVSK